MAQESWIKKVVVAVDGSDASLQGLNQAVDIAQRTRAEMIVAFARHVPPAAFAGSVVPAAVIETLDEQEDEVGREVKDRVSGSGIAWSFVVLRGSPGEEIVNLIRDAEADLVVVGSNKHGSVHNLLLGSTSAYLASHSPAAILVVRPPVEADRVAPNGKRPAAVSRPRGASLGVQQS